MRFLRRSGVPSAIFAAALVLVVVGGTACSSTELAAIDDQHGGDDGLPKNPGGAGADGGVATTGGDPAGPKPLIYSGRYELTSIVDLAGAGAFGTTISTTLVQLSLFHDHPAATILNLMALYDVPYFSEVWNVLPGFIKDKVTDLLDQLIVDALFDNIPAVDHAAELITDIGAASRNVELVTEMTLTGPTGGGALMRGSHLMKGLGFHLWGAHASIPVPSAFQQITQLDVRASLTTIPNPEPYGPSAHLGISKQNFAIPYGNMIMDAVRDLVFRPDGAEDLGSWLNVLINCRSIGSALGNLCVLGGCVKDLVSVSDLTGFCQGGLSTVGLVAETAVRSLTIELADLSNGACDMYDKGYDDAKGDGKMSALSNGNWDMLIKIGGVAKTVKSPFDGKRIADN
jgi:hypothetical protein